MDGRDVEPVRGCSMISEGCTNCYAARQALRHAGPGGAYEGLAVMGKKLPLWTGEVRMVEHARELPLTWRKQRRVFVNSMSDLFHPLLLSKTSRRSSTSCAALSSTSSKS